MTPMRCIDWTHVYPTRNIAPMAHSKPQTRRSVGERVAPIELPTLAHGSIRVPDPQHAYVHLQFRRFAGCPVCNLHLHRFAQGHARLEAAQVRSVAFFHSSAELMRPYQGSLPFPVVPDPDRRWYRIFGVERSALAVVHRQVVWSALRGLVGAPSNPFAGGTDQTGLPADFMIDPDGTIAALHYGKHADDQWSLDELLELVATRAPTATTGAVIM
ncbi:MAG TPA: peroxiredoxin-like family protein [Polyangiaceae bacterium]|nr:peroxiredoxin-like family protein [Polyangiaceae bacterium]